MLHRLSASGDKGFDFLRQENYDVRPTRNERILKKILVVGCIIALFWFLWGEYGHVLFPADGAPGAVTASDGAADVSISELLSDTARQLFLPLDAEVGDKSAVLRSVAQRAQEAHRRGMLLQSELNTIRRLCGDLARVNESRKEFAAERTAITTREYTVLTRERADVEERRKQFLAAHDRSWATFAEHHRPMITRELRNLPRP
jgi:hypothetical protein